MQLHRTLCMKRMLWQPILTRVLPGRYTAYAQPLCACFELRHINPYQIQIKDLVWVYAAHEQWLSTPKKIKSRL